MCQARFSLPTGSAALGPVHSAVAQPGAHHYLLLLGGHGDQHYHQSWAWAGAAASSFAEAFDAGLG